MFENTFLTILGGLGALLAMVLIPLGLFVAGAGYFRQGNAIGGVMMVLPGLLTVGLFAWGVLQGGG